VQPPNPRIAAAHIAVTSDGLRTLLLVEGESEPVPLSPNLSPMGSPVYGRSPTHSPMHRSPAQSPTARSPLHRSMTGASGASGTAVGTFSTILLPQGSQQL
jgi:hypothetical protein